MTATPFVHLQNERRTPTPPSTNLRDALATAGLLVPSPQTRPPHPSATFPNGLGCTISPTTCAISTTAIVVRSPPKRAPHPAKRSQTPSNVLTPSRPLVNLQSEHRTPATPFETLLDSSGSPTAHTTALPFVHVQNQHPTPEPRSRTLWDVLARRTCDGRFHPRIYRDF
ncbi:glycoside hydrolase family 15 protein [Tulasnella calospora MUT 4182]|uniref:Glycoside hydrolase family 15 protein n=1 Tax=Tulasnella calospora MUT 4182 TaxID=1051891 RepID=A0A0C3L178_9AGAM|nr:glycoside hydrolase family 15 protein [Tulasnella calospora MUT 4182]